MTVKLCNPLLPGRTSFSCFHKTNDRYIYAIGGNTAYDQSLASVQRFNIYRRNWEKLPDLIHARANCTSMLYGDSLYVLGGFCLSGASGQTVVHSVEKLDLKTMKWQEVNGGDYPHKACNFMYQMSDNSFLIFGGWKSHTTSKEIDDFNPITC